jgi:hypothetical protein
MPEVIRPSLENVLELTQSVVIELVADEKHQSWVRWIHISINKYFLENKGSLPMYLEGDERTLQDEAEFYELRIDGPFIIQPHKDYYLISVDINVLVQAHMRHDELYNIQTAVGPIVKAFNNYICVYKYGDTPHDDDSLLGALRLEPALDKGTVDVNYFGIIREDTRLTQATIEGHYRMEISNNGSN